MLLDHALLPCRKSVSTMEHLVIYQQVIIDPHVNECLLYERSKEHVKDVDDFSSSSHMVKPWMHCHE